jgi:hypothetical protein
MQCDAMQCDARSDAMLKRIHSIGAHDRPSPVCHAMRSSDEAEVATDAEDSAAYEVEDAGIPGHTCARS